MRAGVGLGLVAVEPLLALLVVVLFLVGAVEEVGADAAEEDGGGDGGGEAVGIAGGEADEGGEEVETTEAEKDDAGCFHEGWFSLMNSVVFRLEQRMMMRPIRGERMKQKKKLQP